MKRETHSRAAGRQKLCFFRTANVECMKTKGGWNHVPSTEKTEKEGLGGDNLEQTV